MSSIFSNVPRISQPFRSVLWWNHIVSPLVGLVYGLGWYGMGHLQSPFQNILLFTCSLLGTASFGYWINDMADQTIDQKAGKPNATLQYPFAVNVLIAVGLLLAGAIPWYFLDFSPVGLHAWLGVLATLILYSLPPFRWKEKGLLGVLCDAGYGHLFPVWIVFGVFASPGILEATHWPWFALAISLLLTLKGVRNICLHQLEDRHRDRIAGVPTLILAWGPMRTAQFISWVILPLELGLLLILAAFTHPVFLVGLLFFLFTYGLRVWSWKFYRSYSQRMVFRLWYVLNDFYEGSFPLLALLLLMITHPHLWWLFPIHLLFFPQALVHWQWVWKTWKNLTFWCELRKFIF